MNNNDIPTSRKVFLQIPREEQIGTLFDWCQSMSSTQAVNVRERDELKSKVKYIEGELHGVARRKSMTTSENIRKELSKQNAVWIWYRDHVLAPTLAAVHTLIIMAVLYLAFGGKIP